VFEWFPAEGNVYPIFDGNPEVSDLRGTASAPSINLAVDNQPAADARADRDVKDRRHSLSGTEQRLGESGYVGVVAQDRGPAEHVFDPASQRKIIPTFDLV